MTGFGPVKLLPGIADDWTINSAVTLPIGVEAYAAFALSAWLTSAPVGVTTRRFARISALGALGLGMFGQIAYHLLEVQGETDAPVPVTVLVSCLPVLVLGLGAALAHMLHRDRLAAEVAPVDAEIAAVERVADPDPVDPGPGRGTRPVDPADVHPALHPAPAEPVHPVEVNPGAPGAAPAPAPGAIPAPRPVLAPVGNESAPAESVDVAEVHPALHPALHPAPAVNGHQAEVHPAAPVHDPAPAPGAIPAPRPILGPGEEGNDPSSNMISAFAQLLEAQSSDAARIRFAIGTLGIEAGPAQISDWLAEWGHVIKIETIRSTLRRERAKHAKDSDPIASVTPLRGQK
ncbi:hypothetical protein ACWDOR_43205 [Streptosporangium canum]